MDKSNKVTEVTNLKLAPIPEYLMTPEVWVREAQNRAAEYLGMPESSLFLTEARRYIALAQKIKDLEHDLQDLKDFRDLNQLG